VKDSMLEMPTDSSRKHDALQIAILARQIFQFVAMRNPHHVLFDDRTVVTSVT